MADMPGSASGLEAKFYDWFVTKAPFQIPQSVRETIVKLSPWITLILLILFIPAALAVIGIGSLVGSLATAAGVSIGAFYYVAFAVLLIQLVVMLIALPKLFKRQRGGWQLLYYSTLINAVYDVVYWLGR